jgi:hypothetical protein
VAVYLRAVLDVVNDQRARVHQFREADQVHVLARVATDGIAARQGAYENAARSDAVKPSDVRAAEA